MCNLSLVAVYPQYYPVMNINFHPFLQPSKL